MSPARRPIVVISDAAPLGDDVMALAMVARCRALELRGVVATDGNVWAHRSASNVRRVLQLVAAKRIRVHWGLGSSRHRERHQDYRRREAGTGKVLYAGAFSGPGPRSRGPRYGFARYRIPAAAAFIVREAQRARGRLELLILGPATVAAEALRVMPALSTLVRNVYLMGGALEGPGTATRVAEFNVWFDPVAAQRVLREFARVTVVSLDACRDMIIDLDHLEKWRSGAVHPGIREIMTSMKSVAESEGRTEIPLWDEVAAAVCIDRDTVRRMRRGILDVCVEKNSAIGRTSLRSGGGPGARQIVEKVWRHRAIEVMNRTFTS